MVITEDIERLYSTIYLIYCQKFIKSFLHANITQYFHYVAQMSVFPIDYFCVRRCEWVFEFSRFMVIDFLLTSPLQRSDSLTYGSQLLTLLCF